MSEIQTYECVKRVVIFKNVPEVFQIDPISKIQIFKVSYIRFAVLESQIFYPTCSVEVIQN